MRASQFLSASIALVALIIVDQTDSIASPPLYRLDVAGFHQGADYGLVTGFNNATNAVYIQHSFGTRSYWWNGTQSLQLPAISPLGQSVALDVNDQNTVVGVEVRSGTQRSATIWNRRGGDSTRAWYARWTREFR